jgi:hypothetical protein
MIGGILDVMMLLHDLNGNKIIKVKEKYPVLKTRKKSIENWWNSLNYTQKVEVGSVVVHYNKMSVNYKWYCQPDDTFEKLTKGQQRLINFAFLKRNERWFFIDVATSM